MHTFIPTMHDNCEPKHDDHVCKKQLLHNNGKPKHDDNNGEHDFANPRKTNIEEARFCQGKGAKV